VTYGLSIDTKIDDCKFEFSVNFSRFRRFRTQQQLNEWLEWR